MKRAAGVAYRRGRAGFDEAPRRRAVLSLAVPLALALGTGACGVSMPISSLVPEGETTGSIETKPASPLSPDLNAEDWRRAKGALALALDPQGSGAAVSWENPDTGRKGSFVPAGQPFVRSHAICRAFRATVSETASTLGGTACRFSGPDWAIKDVKPAKSRA